MTAEQFNEQIALRWLRKDLSWTQRQAADWWGVSERTWRRYEIGESRVPTPLIRQVAAHADKKARQQFKREKQNGSKA